MIQAQQQINLYHTLFLICMAVFLIGIVLTAVLFILLDIRRIFGIKTGHSVKKKVREMAEENEKTGRLIRVQPVAATADITSKKLRKSGRLSRPDSQESVHSSSANTEYQGSEETSLLQNQQMTEESADTTLLQNCISETKNAGSDRGDTDQTYGRFAIEKAIVIIHTNEVI